MSRNLIVDLDDCSEYRRTLLACPSVIAHGTLLLLGVLVGTVILWLATTEAELIVVTTGRVRSVAEADRVFTGEQFNAATGGRVVEVGFEQGQPVERGDVLIRFDTQRLDNQIDKVETQITAQRATISEVTRLKELQARQFQARLAQSRAELEEVQGRIQRAVQERASKIRLAGLELEEAQERLNWAQKLVKHNAASPWEVRKTELEVQRDATQLQIAQLPVDETAVRVRREALNVVEQEYGVRMHELGLQLADKQAQLDQTLHDLENLKLERAQSVVVATAHGIAISKQPKPGDVIKAGQPVVEIAPAHGYRIDVTLASRDIGHIRVGMPVKVKLDAYDYQQYGTAEGEVVFVSPDSQNTSSDDGSPVPAAPLYTARIALNSHEIGQGEHRGTIKLGMTGRVEIITGQENLLSVLVRKIRQTISLG